MPDAQPDTVKPVAAQAVPDLFDGTDAAPVAGAVSVPALYPAIVRAVRETPWAITPAAFAAVGEVVALRAAGYRLTPAQVRERLAAAPQRKAREGAGGSGVAVIPLQGVIANRADGLQETSGMTSLDRFRGELRAALDDSRVGAILLHVDSPGGAVDGVPETADLLAAARGAKPIVAIADTTAASAAYWIGTAADELVVTPSGEVGSVGVFSAHTEFSRADLLKGVKTTLVSAGRFKTEANPFEPLSESARAALQKRVDEYYGMFVDALARQRGVAASKVREGFGEGRTVSAGEAVRIGMADRVATFDATLAALAERVGQRGSQRGGQRSGNRAARSAASAALQRHRFSFA